MEINSVVSACLAILLAMIAVIKLKMIVFHVQIPMLFLNLSACLSVLIIITIAKVCLEISWITYVYLVMLPALHAMEQLVLIVSVVKVQIGCRIKHA